MKNLVILGAGTSGTMMANHLVSKLPKKEWKISIVDQYKTHYYQPGFLFLPFDTYTEDQVKKTGKKFIPKGVNYIQKKIEKIEAEKNTVKLEDETLNYDILIIATGSKIAPEETEGLLGPLWKKDIFDFYTFEGALALRNKLREWEGGKLVVHLTEMPIKCPVAPLEFAFLADSYFRKKGMRDKVEITYVTPLSGAFTKPTCTKALNYLLEEKGINIEIDLNMLRENKYCVADLLDENDDSLIGYFNDNPILIKKGKFGYYLESGSQKESLKNYCENVGKLTQENAISILEGNIKNKNVVKQITPNLSLRKGKYGVYAFHQSPTMVKPVFYNIKKLRDGFMNYTNDMLIKWICETYNVDKNTI